MLKSTKISTQEAAASALWTMCNANARNQASLLEAKAYHELVDLIQWHANDYIRDPAVSPDKYKVLLAAVGCIGAVTTKNVPMIEAFTEKGALDALLILKDCTDKLLKKELITAVSNVGGKGRSRTLTSRGRSGSFFDKLFSKEEKKEETKSESKKEEEKKEGKEEEGEKPLEKKKKKKKEEAKEEKQEEKKAETKEDKKEEKQEEKKEEKKEEKQEEKKRRTEDRRSKITQR